MRQSRLPIQLICVALTVLSAAVCCAPKKTYTRPVPDNLSVTDSTLTRSEAGVREIVFTVRNHGTSKSAPLEVRIETYDEAGDLTGGLNCSVQGIPKQGSRAARFTVDEKTQGFRVVGFVEQ